MIENINLKDCPQASGVYWFICNDEIVYIGSSSNLYNRMRSHKSCIRKGNAPWYKNGKKDFYLFLQNNPFSVEYELTEKYREIEQELIEKHSPRFNQQRAFCGIGTVKNRRKEYRKAYHDKYLENELKDYYEYYKQHKDKIDEYQTWYSNQKCNFNGEVLKLRTLARRFQRQGIKHSTQEAKKYLIEENEFHIL